MNLLHNDCVHRTLNVSWSPVPAQASILRMGTNRAVLSLATQPSWEGADEKTHSKTERHRVVGTAPDERLNQDNPVQPSLVKDCFSWNQILFDVPHPEPRLYDFFKVASTISPSLRNSSNTAKATSIPSDKRHSFARASNGFSQSMGG